MTITQYIIVNTDLDTFLCQEGRVLFCQLTDFSATTQQRLQQNLPTALRYFSVTPDLVAIVSDDIASLFTEINNDEQLSHHARLLESVTWRTFRQLILDQPTTVTQLLARTLQLARFHQDHHFCSRCGTPTEPHPTDTAVICPQCHYHQYPRLQPCTITAVVKFDKSNPSQPPKILLAHHHRAKSTGMYGLIAGFVEVGESLETCVHREVIEEVNLTVTNIRYFASQPWPFPSNLMMGFIADYVSGDIRIQEEELIHADFFALNDLPIIPQAGTIAYDLIMAVKAEYSLSQC